jgi:voltage-gated potassium channel
MRVPIIASAILPLIIVPETNGWVGVVVGIVTWLVFLVDYVVHVRHLEHYGRTGFGRFDLLVVIATAPWFLIPGTHTGGLLIVLRLARLTRLVTAGKGSRHLFQRLGRVVAVALGVVVLGSLVAFYTEHPVNPQFATVGDALWWGLATLTTVGYGDVVPQTSTGRWAAAVIMITGIAVLGILAGALASFFRLDDSQADTGSPASGPPSPTSTDAALQTLTAEVAALRRQVEALTQRLTRTPPDPTPEEQPPAKDAATAPLPIELVAQGAFRVRAAFTQRRSYSSAIILGPPRAGRRTPGSRCLGAACGRGHGEGFAGQDTWRQNPHRSRYRASGPRRRAPPRSRRRLAGGGSGQRAPEAPAPNRASAGPGRACRTCRASHPGGGLPGAMVLSLLTMGHGTRVQGARPGRPAGSTVSRRPG